LLAEQALVALGISGRAAHVGATFSVGIASDASSLSVLSLAAQALVALGISGRAAHVGATFSVGIASDAFGV
jgi:hypothetical protein